MRLKQTDVHPLSAVQHNGNENLLSDGTTTTTASTEQYTANNRNNIQQYNNQQQQLNNLHNAAVINNSATDSVRRRQDTLQWCNTINTIQHQQTDNTVVGVEHVDLVQAKQQHQLKNLQQPRSVYNINNTLAASLPVTVAVPTANSRCDESSPDDSLLDYEEAHQSCSSVDTSPQDEDRGFDLSDSESLSDDGNISSSHPVQSRGIVNPNYPGFQHLAHTLDYTIKACSDTDFTDDDLDLDTNTCDVNNINNNNNNEEEYKIDSIDSVNRLDSVENIQKVFYDKPKLNIPLEFDSGEKRNNCDSGEEATGSNIASDEDLDGNVLSDQEDRNITESFSSADIVGDFGKEIECELGKLVAREVEQELEEAVEKLTVTHDLSPTALKYNIEPNSGEPFEKIGPVLAETIQILEPLIVKQGLPALDTQESFAISNGLVLESKPFDQIGPVLAETVEILESAIIKQELPALDTQENLAISNGLVLESKPLDQIGPVLAETVEISEPAIIKQELPALDTQENLAISNGLVLESKPLDQIGPVLAETVEISEPAIIKQELPALDTQENLAISNGLVLESKPLDQIGPVLAETVEISEPAIIKQELSALDTQESFAISNGLDRESKPFDQISPVLAETVEISEPEIIKQELPTLATSGGLAISNGLVLESKPFDQIGPVLAETVEIESEIIKQELPVLAAQGTLAISKPEEKKSVQFVEADFVEPEFVSFRPELVEQMADIKVAKVTSTEALTIKLNQFSQPKDFTKMKTADAFLSETKDSLPEFTALSDLKPKEADSRKSRRDSNRETEEKDTKMETDEFEKFCKENKTKDELEKDEDSTVPRKKEKMEINYVKKRRDSSQQIGSLITIPRRELGGRNRDNLANRRSVPAAREKKKASPEVLGGFDVYNIETAMPKIDLDAIENHLRAAREEERRRRTDREEIRRRLAMGSEDDYYNGCDRPGRKPSLQARLQSGMNLQICFMNETASDTESPNSDTECSLAEPKHSSLPVKPHLHKVQLRESKPSAQPRPVSLPLGNAQPLLQPVTQPMTEADFFARQARLQTEARMALAQAKEMAHMQMEVERQRQKKSPITEMIRSSLEKVGIPFPEERRRVSRQILTEMNVAQLQVIVNDLHTQIETLNENLVRYLMNRDDLHMEQDSMLVDIEDLTRYLGAKEQTVKEQKLSSQNNNIPPPSPAPASPLSAINNSVKPRLHRIASLVKK